jgi:hypothetical protein
MTVPFTAPSVAVTGVFPFPVAMISPLMAHIAVAAIKFIAAVVVVTYASEDAQIPVRVSNKTWLRQSDLALLMLSHSFD